MSQFDVYRLDRTVLVADLQTDLIGLTATRIVAPLRRLADAPDLAGLTPECSVEGERYRIIVPELAAVAGTSLGRPVADCLEQRDALMRAVDILTHGF